MTLIFKKDDVVYIEKLINVYGSAMTYLFEGTVSKVLKSRVEVTVEEEVFHFPAGLEHPIDTKHTDVERGILYKLWESEDDYMDSKGRFLESQEIIEELLDIVSKEPSLSVKRDMLKTISSMSSN